MPVWALSSLYHLSSNGPLLVISGKHPASSQLKTSYLSQTLLISDRSDDDSDSHSECGTGQRGRDYGTTESVSRRPSIPEAGSCLGRCRLHNPYIEIHRLRTINT